jgi:hypothetical protein
MSDDLAVKIRELVNVRSLVGEEAYERALAELRTQYGDALVEQVLHEQLPADPSVAGQAQEIAGAAEVGIAVAGNIYGNVTVAGVKVPGYDGHEAAELIRGYLEVVRHRSREIQYHCRACASRRCHRASFVSISTKSISMLRPLSR